MPDAVYEEIQKEDSRLRSQLQAMLKMHTLEHLRRPENCASFLAEVNTLLENIKHKAANVKTREEYAWLAEATKNWQLMCLGVLSAPMYIEVLGAPSSFDVEYAGQWNQRAIEQWVKQKAFFVAKNRLDLMKTKLLMDLLGRNAEQLLSSREEAAQDWFFAERFFALDILKGDLDFCLSATSELFDALGHVWLYDVMHVYAYFIWKERKLEVLQSDEEARRADFYEACALFRDRLADERIKCASDDAVQKCKEYVVKRYLKEDEAGKGIYQLDKAKAEEQIKRRAQRSFDLALDPNERRNYYHAEEYVRSFYESAIPAVLGSGQDNARAKENIYLVFEKSDGPNYYSSIADCFEAAVLMYCVRDLPHLAREATRGNVNPYTGSVGTRSPRY